MTNTLRLQIIQKELDNNETESNVEAYIAGCDFSFSNRQTFTMLSGNIYNTVNFGAISSTTGLKITSSEQITCKFNGTDQEFIINSFMVSFGVYSEISIRNNSGSTATITVELYGS